MTSISFRFPRGFTVRDLDFIYEVVCKHARWCDEEFFTWDADGISFNDADFDIETLKAIRDDFAAHEWDVKPVSEVWGVGYVC